MGRRHRSPRSGQASSVHRSPANNIASRPSPRPTAEAAPEPDEITILLGHIGRCAAEISDAVESILARRPTHGRVLSTERNDTVLSIEDIVKGSIVPATARLMRTDSRVQIETGNIVESNSANVVTIPEEATPRRVNFAVDDTPPATPTASFLPPTPIPVSVTHIAKGQASDDQPDADGAYARGSVISFASNDDALGIVDDFVSGIDAESLLSARSTQTTHVFESPVAASLGRRPIPERLDDADTSFAGPRGKPDDDDDVKSLNRHSTVSDAELSQMERPSLPNESDKLGMVIPVPCPDTPHPDSQAEFNLTSASVMMLDHVMGRPQDEQPPDNPDTDASKRQAGKDSRKMLKSAINELIDTEKSYLYKLRHLHREFAQRLRAYHETDGTIVILTTDQIQKVFSNIDDIVKLHTQVYRDIKVLKAKDRLVEGLPDLLTTLAVNVASIYTQYAIDFACNQRIVVDLVASIPAFAQFVSVSERCCSTRGVRLDSLRIEPIQRVSRYILLVDAIRRYSDKAQQVKLEEVVQQFRDSAEHVDANMKVAQAKRRVVEIQEEFLENLPNPSLVTNGRYCVRESNLQMLSHKKGWTGAVRHVHRMYSFVLFNDILIFATIISENPRRGRLKGRLDLLHTAVDDNISDENDTSFVISSTSDPSKPSLFILAKTPQQKKEWVDDLQICIRQKAEAHGLLPPGASEDSLNSGDYKRAFRPFSQATVPLTRPMPLATNQEQVAVDQAVADGTLQIELAKKLTRKASSRIQ